MADLTNENIIMHLANRKGVAPATRNKELAELLAMWRFAVQIGVHTGWPDIQEEPEPKRIPQAWTKTDIVKLMKACKKQNGNIGSVPAWLWWYSLVRLTLDTGERISAVISCRWEWLEDGGIIIPAEVRKGSKSDKWYKLSQECVDLLGTVRVYSQSKLIFHWPYHKGYLWSRYKKIIQEAGLPDGRKSGFHRNRKTVASVAYAAGLDPQDLLDHTDRRTTQRYLDPRFSRSIQASDVIAEWIGDHKDD